MRNYAEGAMRRRVLHLILVVAVLPVHAQRAPTLPTAVNDSLHTADESSAFVVWETGGELSKPSGYAIGEMVADRVGDTVVVRYRYDRRSQEGGQRSETRYRISAAGQMLLAESQASEPGRRRHRADRAVRDRRQRG